MRRSPGRASVRMSCARRILCRRARRIRRPPAQLAAEAEHVGHRVVIVRPERPAHTLIAAAFEMSGCEVYCASDGHAAWTLVVQKRPRILLMEYPDEVDGGFELLERAHAVRKLGTLVATAVSNGLSAERTAGIAACSDLCYRMPKSPADVVRAVLHHVRGSDPGAEEVASQTDETPAAHDPHADAQGI